VFVAGGPAAVADYTAKLDHPTGGGAVLFAVCRGKVGACFCSVCACILPGVLYLLIFMCGGQGRD
jgi:hypothetical protein